MLFPLERPNLLQHLFQLYVLIVQCEMIRQNPAFHLGDIQKDIQIEGSFSFLLTLFGNVERFPAMLCGMVFQAAIIGAVLFMRYRFHKARSTV